MYLPLLKFPYFPMRDKVFFKFTCLCHFLLISWISIYHWRRLPIVFIEQLSKYFFVFNDSII